ncbi:MAG: aconitate hydratase AcnA, partial [Anaerolineaceae bacterium]|nr:aconitate hydratase AcnA [Anaerolineaceae bacterium]
MQDFSGVPALVDLAALRFAVARNGGNPQQVNPVISVDLVIDHSLEVNYSALPDAFQRNLELEYQRNTERYTFLRWGQKAFKNLRIIPPGAGIIHQINLEYLSPVVLTQSLLGELTAFPDTVIGTDSHTTMINGLGVVGWGVGGIEAVAAMLGEPFEMPVPDVVGFRLFGELREGVTPTDLTLKITQILRASGVVGKYVEFFGRGLKSLSLPDRAMIANMSPENGATISYFPVDDETLAYMRLTGRPPAQVELVETYFKTQQLYRTEDTPDPLYSETIELDIGTVEPSLAGPKRPQDRVPLSQVAEGFRQALTRERSERGYALGQEQVSDRVQFNLNGNSTELTHGAVILAAITSCTNTSNPYVMVGAGLLAKKAVEKGLVVSPTVKTSLAPGSRVVTEYLERAGLLQPLSALGFDIVGYGCTTCIGNSGPLAPAITQALSDSSIIAASVISGNRNFEGRVHPLIQANYLASPPLVIAYALAGTVDIDLASQPLGFGTGRQPVYLKDIWPSTGEIQDVINRHLTPELFTRSYADIFSGSQAWQLLEAGDSPLYPWNPESTYIQEPPYIN